MSKKLVRDKIPELYPGKKNYVADDKEYYIELIKKLQEEVDEFKKDESVEELADVIEVIYAISEFKGISTEELENIRKKKKSERGAFKKRIIWEGN